MQEEKTEKNISLTRLEERLQELEQEERKALDQLRTIQGAVLLLRQLVEEVSATS
jgi:beta-phosphoglucomutase-like phosphatase (HAD superfamily)